MKKFTMFVMVSFFFLAFVAGNTVMGQVTQNGEWDANPFATLDKKHAREVGAVASKETIKTLILSKDHVCYVFGQGLWSLDPRTIPRIYARAQKIFETEQKAGFFWNGSFEMGRFIDTLVSRPVLDGEFWEAINTEKSTSTYIFGSGSRKAYKFEMKLQTPPPRENEFLGQVCINLSPDPVVAVVGCEPCKAPEPKRDTVISTDSIAGRFSFAEDDGEMVAANPQKADDGMEKANPKTKKPHKKLKKVLLFGGIGIVAGLGTWALLSNRKSKPAPPADQPNTGSPGSGGNNGGSPGSGGRFAKLLVKLCEKIQALQQ